MDSYSPQQYFHKLENMLLNSSQVLRKLFQLHWKTTSGKPWEETEKLGKQFIDGIGQSVYKDSTKKQKRLIAKGLLSEWDLSTLSTALQVFRNAEQEDDKTKAEFNAVISLKRLSNELSRHPTKKFYKKEFNRRFDTFRSSLRALQVKEERIDIMVKKAGATSSQTTFESFKKLLEEGVRELKSNEFTKALECFLMATNIPSLLLAEKYKVPAFFDAKQALECNDESWKAHHLLAQLYANYKKLDEAFEHCETAVVLAPEKTQLKTYLTYLKTLKGWLNLVEVDSFHIPFLPVPLTEFGIQIKAEKGIIIKLTEEQLRIVQKSGVFKGQEEVMQGNEYARGLTVSQDYEEAVRLFIKAAEVKNAAGIYALGFCYFFELGVKKNIEKAHELFLEAANLPACISVPASDFRVENFGVSDSQYALATFYLDDMIGEPDCSEVTKWYRKSAENGNENATYSLGLLHTEGIGYPRNLKMGETYLKEAINLGNYKSPLKLLQLYSFAYEPEKAREMLKLIKSQDVFKVSESAENLCRKKFNHGISLRKNCEQDVLAFEGKHNVDGNNTLFFLRADLYKTGGKSVKNILKFLKEAQSTGTSYNLWLDGNFKWDDLLYEKFVRLYHEGSPSGCCVMASLQSNYKLWELIIDIMDTNVDVNNKFIKLLHATFLHQFYYGTYIYLPPGGENTLKRITTQFFKRKCVGDGYKSEEDKDIRFCYIYVQILCGIKAGPNKDISMMLEMLLEGIEIYPDDNHFYNLLSYLFLRDEKHEVGLYYVLKGLEKLLNDKQLLFARAKHFSMLPDSDSEESIINYKRLLSETPGDYCLMPDAYYSIANVYRVIFGEDENNKRALNLMKQYYKMGQWSEGNMLPCYLPYKSKSKVLVANAIETTEVSSPSIPTKV
ncbi:unnamed protein product [Orchesella dallaii]|uniref:Uncharacterized protein n=1 Tax=Orchesella dallaii TaxID=48710 RepID=A0ABP1QNU5_9HEXA